MLFELLHLECHRRLGHEQLFRCLGKAQLLCDGVEDLQSAISHLFGQKWFSIQPYFPDQE
jgi:hypothetical protein